MTIPQTSTPTPPTPEDVGLTIAGGRVICPQHDPCPTGQVKWLHVRAYGGDAARFASITDMWMLRGFAGQYAGQTEVAFIAAHLTDEQRQAQEAQAARARGMPQRGHSRRRNRAEAPIGGSPVEVAS